MSQTYSFHCRRCKSECEAGQTGGTSKLWFYKGEKGSETSAWLYEHSDHEIVFQDNETWNAIEGLDLERRGVKAIFLDGPHAGQMAHQMFMSPSVWKPFKMDGHEEELMQEYKLVFKAPDHSYAMYSTSGDPEQFINHLLGAAGKS